MTRSQRLALVGVLTFFSASSLPRSSHAQVATGTWVGVESVTTENFFNGQLISESFVSNIPSTLVLTFVPWPDPLTVYMSLGAGPSGFDEQGHIQSFGPQGASGSVVLDGYPASFSVGNFDVTYQAILPDGTIDTTGGFAVADLDISLLEYLSPASENIFISFQNVTVPEPSSLVLAASGTLVMLVFVWMRGFSGNTVESAVNCAATRV